MTSMSWQDGLKGNSGLIARYSFDSTDIGIYKLVRKEIENISEQQARMVLDEWLKQYKIHFESKESKLKIKIISNPLAEQIYRWP